MPAPRPQDVLVKVARLYYLEDRSQGDIAKQLGVSRSSVSRILTSAREQGVVEIRIHPPGQLTRVGELEDAFTREFGIAEPRIVRRPTGRAPIDIVGEMAARVFESQVAHLSTVGLSWGYTISQFVEHVSLEPIYRDLHLFPLAGGMPTGDTGPSGNTSLETLAHKCGATAYRFESPSVVESRQTWQALSGESAIVAAIERAANVRMAVIGIGSYGVRSSARVMEAMGLNPDEKAETEARHPAGDLNGRFFDIDGVPLGPPTSERVIGVSMEQLAKVPQVYGLCGGVDKARGLVGALRTGVLDGVVVDEDLAAAALKVARHEH